MNIKISLIFISVAVIALPVGFALFGLLSDNITKGYAFQDKYEKLWLPYNFHVEMHENKLSRFAQIKDVRGRVILYYKNDYRTPHSSLFFNENLSFEYKLIGKKDSLDEHGLKKIRVLASRSFSRESKDYITRYAEFYYYADSVNEQLCDEIISSLRHPSIR